MPSRPSLLIVLDILLAAFLCGIVPFLRAAEGGGAAELYRQFQDPPKLFGLMPYWYWNGRITPQETRRQIRSMVDQGVYSAIVFPWDGMELPYLEEPWWEALGTALDAASEAGLTLNLNDDFTWPSGHAWDHYQQSAELSRVLRGNPDYRMKTLVSEEHTVQGPAQWDRTFPEKPEVIVAGRPGEASDPDPESLRQLDFRGNTIHWHAPPGTWRVYVYTLRPVTGAHNTRVDLLNQDAVARHIEIFYQELVRRFPQHLGRTLTLTTADHEGTYGVHPVWTPGLWNRFRDRYGYDLRPLLPLLQSTKRGPAVRLRSDYFDLVSEMYRESFVEQVTRFCESHGIRHTASFYEEQLAIQVKQAGDMFGLWRTMSEIEIDALLERARMPIDFKEAVSAAHFEGKQLLVENQGLQGHDSFLSPEKMRAVTNMVLLWGAQRLIPYFDYEPAKIQWPPQWFESQPYWRYFRRYADYVRRVSFMNSRGTHQAPIAVYYPLESARAESSHLFDGSHRNELQWDNAMDDVQAWYSTLQLELARQGWDYHVVDAHYLEQATLASAHLRIGEETFRVLILPPLFSIHREAMRKIRAFYDRGGTVIGILELPAASPEGGYPDSEIVEGVGHVFGQDAILGKPASNRNSSGGAAYFFPCDRYQNFMNVLNYRLQVEVPAEYQDDLSPVLETLNRHLRREADVVGGNAAGIYVSHRHEGPVHFYWVVNDTDRARNMTLLLSPSGTAQEWDPLTGGRSRLPSRITDQGTEVELELEPRGGTFVVLGETPADLPVKRSRRTLRESDLTGNRWIFTPESPEIRVPFARIRTGKDGEGEKAAWLSVPADSAWTEEWLSVERLANPTWWLIGPFPYGDHSGYNEVFPPETEVNLEATYTGQDGKRVSWSYLTAESFRVNVRDLLEIRRPAWSVAYAFSHVYSPTEREARVRLAFADSVKLWWNGEQKLAIHRHPKWMLLSDPWSESVPVLLREGWNRVLLKICRSENRPVSFVFRIADPSGNTLKDVVYAKSTGPPPEKRTEGEKWYRVVAPPGTRSVGVPGFDELRRIYLDGKRVSGKPGDWLPVKPGDRIHFVCGAREQLEHPVRFKTGSTVFVPGSWSRTSLENYSGLAAYETEFPFSGVSEGKQVELDLGTVGLTAEVWLNDQRVGVRIWTPYTFDITEFIRPGSNRLRITVANSDANWQSQGETIYPAGSWGLEFETEHERLEKIYPNGLIGPVVLRVRE